jgi:hypothetical protein
MNHSTQFEAVSNTALGYEPCKMLERTIIGSLGISRETACGKLSAAQVITQAIATCSLF